MSVNVRRICLELLYEINENEQFCDMAIHKAMEENPKLDARDRGFLLTLTEGVVERRIELDYFINMYSSKPVDKLKPFIKNILRMAVYQLKYMDQVPHSAAVNEAVKLTIAKGYSGLRGFVNGILRNMSRTVCNAEYPDKVANPVEYMSIKHSMPKWLVEHYISELGDNEAENVLEYFLNNFDTVIRCTGIYYNKNELEEKIRECGVEVIKGSIFDYALHLKRTGVINNLPGYSEGSFVVQDESSMIPAHIAACYAKDNYLINDRKVLNVLDLCAAPGGKTLQIADNMGENVQIQARDVSNEKLDRIIDNAKRLGLSNISVKFADALKPDKSCVNKYDIVIADLPCSGLGVIGKKPDIKYNASLMGTKELAVMQKKILNNAAEYVVQGGIIIYSTCTINRIENEDNALAFIKDHTNYDLVQTDSYLPPELHDCILDNGFVKVIPGKIKADGFFVAVFKRL